jgi:hypothetical protein
MLMSMVFPTVPTIAEIDPTDPDLLLKRLVYKDLNADVWGLTRPLTGKLQELLADRDGLVLCRLGGLRGEQVYVTKDPECFRLDVIESRSEQDITRTTTLSMFYGGISTRCKNMAPIIAEAFDLSLRQQLAAGRAHIPLLIDKYADDGGDGEQQ